MTLRLYNNAADPLQVDKTDFLEIDVTIYGTLRSECSVQSPVINIGMNRRPTANYAYIIEFGRYYFITAVTAVAENLWRLSLNCDVLMSFKDEIKALSAVVGRQENDVNPLLVDDRIPTQKNLTVERVNAVQYIDTFKNDMTADNHCFVLTVVK